MMNQQPKRITDLSIQELREGLAEIIRSVGPDCGTARIYRRVLAEKETSAAEQTDDGPGDDAKGATL